MEKRDLRVLRSAIATAEAEKVVEAAMIEEAKALVPVLATEAVRRFGVAGGNSKLVQVGRYTLEGDALGIRYTYYLENGAETERAASHSAVASHCSSDLLVLRFPTRAYLIFSRLAAQSDVDKALDEWGVGPNAEKMDEDGEASEEIASRPTPHTPKGTESFDLNGAVEIACHRQCRVLWQAYARCKEEREEAKDPHKECNGATQISHGPAGAPCTVLSLPVYGCGWREWDRS